MAMIGTRDASEIYSKDWRGGQPVAFSHGWPRSADMRDYRMLPLASRWYRTAAFHRRITGSVLRVHPDAPHATCMTHKDQANIDLLARLQG